MILPSQIYFSGVGINVSGIAILGILSILVGKILQFQHISAL
jgi:hypothetical protein